jgi:hypothetical protein
VNFPELPTTFELIYEVPDHQILLVFNGDDEAADFLDWLSEKGWAQFRTDTGR